MLWMWPKNEDIKKKNLRNSKAEDRRASGTRVDVQSDHKLSTEQVEQDFKKLGLETDSVVLSGQKENQAAARFVGVPNKEKVRWYHRQI